MAISQFVMEVLVKISDIKDNTTMRLIWKLLLHKYKMKYNNFMKEACKFLVNSPKQFSGCQGSLLVILSQIV